MNNKLINCTKKHLYGYYIFNRKKKSGSTISGSGSADPDPHQNDPDERIRNTAFIHNSRIKTY